MSIRTARLKLFLAGLWLSMPAVAGAQADSLGGLRNIGNEVYGSDEPTPLAIVIGNIVQAVLVFVGTIFIVLILWAGLQWMTSGGNEEKIKAAKRHIVNATIGLTIIFVSFSVARFITNSLANAT